MIRSEHLPVDTDADRINILPAIGQKCVRGVIWQMVLRIAHWKGLVVEDLGLFSVFPLISVAPAFHTAHAKSPRHQRFKNIQPKRNVARSCLPAGQREYTFPYISTHFRCYSPQIAFAAAQAQNCTICPFASFPVAVVY